MSPITRWVTFHHPHCRETERSLADARMPCPGGSMTNRATNPGQPAQPVLECSSVRNLTGQSMPRVQASRAFSCSMNPVTPTLVPKPKFLHWPGCQGTHEARHLLFHCPFYNSAGKEPLGAVHTFGSRLQGQVPGQGRPKRLLEGQVCKPDKAIFTWIDPLNTLPPTLPTSDAQGAHRSSSQKGKGDPALWH